MNIYALFFGPAYYAGYGKIKTGLVMAVIGFMPLTMIAVNIYASMNANNDLPVGAQPFNLRSAILVACVSVLISIIAMFLIMNFKEN